MMVGDDELKKIQILGNVDNRMSDILSPFHIIRLSSIAHIHIYVNESIHAHIHIYVNESICIDSLTYI